MICSPESKSSESCRFPVIFAAILFLQLLLAIALVYTRAPHGDEGTFGNAAYLLLTKGYLAMPTVELPGLDRYMYWNMPLYMLTVAGWFKLFGVSLFGERLVSVLCGLLSTIAWQYIVRHVTGDRSCAILCMALIGLNYDVLNVSTAGRTDMMCVALYTAGMASYLLLREHNLTWAILVSQGLLAMSLTTHPYAAFGIFAVFVFALVYDSSRLNGKHLMLAALPYVIAVGAWCLYAAQAPEIAKSQLLGNIAAGRINSFSHPLRALFREINERYLAEAVGFRPGAPAVMRLRLLIFLAYFGAWSAGIGFSSFRRRPGHALLLFLMGADFLLLTYFENLKWYVYIIHVIPIYSCVLGLFFAWIWRKPELPRIITAAAVGLFLLFNVSSIAYRVRLDTYHKAFQPAGDFLLRTARPGELIIASSEFAHVFGFRGWVIDDPRLGFRTGRVPVFIVVESRFEMWFEKFRSDPLLTKYIQKQLSERALLFQIEYANVFYRIYGPADRKQHERLSVSQ